MPNGKFVLVSDPRPGSGPAQEGWQTALWQEMAEAIQKGEEQVVMVFSRPGCPWCQKLHPVLQNAAEATACWRLELHRRRAGSDVERFQVSL